MSGLQGVRFSDPGSGYSAHLSCNTHQRWKRILRYVDDLEVQGGLMQRDRARVVDFLARWMLYQLVSTRMEHASEKFDRKLDRKLVRALHILARK